MENAKELYNYSPLILYFIIVFIFTMCHFLKSFKNRIPLKGSIISIIAYHIVLLGFLVYTFVYLIGFKFISFLDANEISAKANFDINKFIAILIYLLTSKSLYEQFTYFATLAGLVALLETNFKKFVYPNLIRRRNHGPTKTKEVLKIENLEEEIRLRKILLEHYKRNQK